MSLKTEDTCENRALFMVMWHGSKSGELSDLFPDWYSTRMKLKSGSFDETLWLADFCEKAMEMQKLPEEV